MVNVYVTLVKNGKRTIEQVPASVREQVREILAAEEAEKQKAQAGQNISDIDV